jgi:chromosome partitioning protein
MADLLRYLNDHPGLFVAAGALLSAICGVIGLAIKWWQANRDRNELQHQVSDLQHQLGQLRERSKHLEEDCTAAQAANHDARSELQRVQTQAQETQTELTNQLEAAKEESQRHDAAGKKTAKLIKQMLKLEGRLWEKRIHVSAGKFRPLDGRRAPIISLLNLKGGVGKTTLTAHLGAALVNRGYRPLLVDLDLQGSLSGMFIPGDLLVKRSDDELLLQHFLAHAAHHRALNLLDYVAPILGDRAGLVATSDKLAYAELNLTVHWLLRLGKRDTRFLLRRALHQKRVTKQYDVILLDCPPLINTCCTNALAASDYVLIPVMPSKKAMERVPQLLFTLRELRTRINPDIQPLGMILNRTYGQTLTAVEQDDWRQLQHQCQDRWGSPVYACRTHVRRTNEVRDAESAFAAPAPQSELYDTFKRLVLEIEERLPRECRRAATAPV